MGLILPQRWYRPDAALSTSGGAPSTFNALSGWTYNTHLLGRTPASSGSRRKFTYSAWILRTGVGAVDRYFFAGGGAGAGNIFVLFWESDVLTLIHAGAGTYVRSSGTYASTTDWYQVTVAVDTDQATAANRVRMYVNDAEVSYGASTAYPAINTDIQINTSSYALKLGQSDFATTSAAQKLAYPQFVDGGQLIPSDFNQAGGLGKVPKLYTGAFGTNGWALDFANTADLGNDVSGNNLDLTVTGLNSGNATSETVTFV